MSRWLVGMSGDKDKMIEHLLKCEKQMVKRFAEIKETANTALNTENMASMHYEGRLREIIDVCDLYLDKRSHKQKMQDEIDEMKEQLLKMKETLEGIE